MAKKPNTNISKAFLRLQCYTMYKNGSSLQEIAVHFHISKEHVSDYISAYLNHDMFDDKILQSDHQSNRMNRSSEHVKELIANAEKIPDPIDITISNGYGWKTAGPSEPQAHSWFKNCCIHVRNFFIFWK